MRRRESANSDKTGKKWELHEFMTEASGGFAWDRPYFSCEVVEGDQYSDEILGTRSSFASQHNPTCIWNLGSCLLLVKKVFLEAQAKEKGLNSNLYRAASLEFSLL